MSASVISVPRRIAYGPRSDRRGHRRGLPARACSLGVLIFVLVAGSCSTSRHSPLAVRKPTAASSTVPTTSTTKAATTTVPSSFKPLTTGVEDWTWVTVNQGWALVRTPCGTTVCVGLRETVNGGTTWTPLPTPDALDSRAQFDSDVACAARPCLSRVRFATSEIGWLFGPALFQTEDGGHTWTRIPSAMVDDLEAANGVAMRITTPDRDCGGGCEFHVDRLRSGSSAWEQLPTALYNFPSLILQGPDAYIVDIPNWAGAGQTYLAHSANEGTTWTSINDPCPGTAAGDRTASASAAPGGVLVVLCVSVDGGSGSVRVSADYGKTFGPRRAIPPIPLSTFGPVAAGSADTIAIAYSRQHNYGVVVTHDNGITWRATLTPVSAALARTAEFTPSIGWENENTARVSFNTDAIWTTRDRGQSWTQNNVTP